MRSWRQGGAIDHIEEHAERCYLAHTGGKSADVALVDERGWVDAKLIHEIQIALSHSAPWARATLQELSLFGAEYTDEQLRHQQPNRRMGAQNLAMCWFAPCGLR